jgi:hypothetical protein
LWAEESSADVTKGGTTAPSTAPLQGREQMRSAAQGKQAGCGLAKKEATKGLLFWIDHALPVDDYLAVHVRIMIPTAMPSAIAIVVTMNNHCSAFAVNRRCRTSYRRCDVAAVGARDGGEGKSPRHGFWKGSTVGGGSLSRRTWLFPLHVLFFVVAQLRSLALLRPVY